MSVWEGVTKKDGDFSGLYVIISFLGFMFPSSFFMVGRQVKYGILMDHSNAALLRTELHGRYERGKNTTAYENYHGVYAMVLNW